MGKRSDFERRPHDAYQTWHHKPVRLLLPYLLQHGVRSFAEPCEGEGHLRRQLTQAGLSCTYSGDILTGQDAMRLTARRAGHPDAYITNPPWTRKLMHPLIAHLMRLGPTWLLFDSDWSMNVEAAPFLQHCSHIVPIGRVIWIEGTTQTGKDNVSWYRFHIQHTDGPRLLPRRRPTRGGSHDESVHPAQ